MFGVKFKDQNITMTVGSNHGKDKEGKLEHAKQLQRPILFEINGDIFTDRRLTNFALTVGETRDLVRELNKMIEHLEV